MAHLLLALPVAACSATSSVEHSPAQFAPIQSTVTVEAGRDVVFERLTARLPAAGFTLLEIDEGLKLLRVSMTTDEPEAYVDCGRFRRTFEGAFGPVETFEYTPASSSSYKLTRYDGVPLEATRDATLDTTATVRTSPQDAMTEVSVAVTFHLNTVTSYKELGSPVGDIQAVPGEVSFRTAEPGTGEAELAYCVSNGRLEAQILELAR